MMSGSANSKSRGFSILELLVSLALLSLIAAGLAGAFSLAFQVWDRSQGINTYQEELAARRLLRTWIIKAEPRSEHLSQGGMQGDGANLSFVTFAETPFEPHAAHTEVRVEGSNDVLRMTARFVDFEGNTLSTEAFVLVHGAKSVQFQYLQEQGNSLEWRQTWNVTQSLPKLIRITTAGDTNPFWPEFIARPRL